MPTKPAHPCNAPSCPALTHERFCPAHTRERRRRFDAKRGNTTERGYGARWRKIRAVHLANEPLCRECGKEDKVVAAQEIDHIVPKARGGTDDEDNLQSLCRHHHSQKTAREVLVR
jgi:5-methylcytosine-specific restriction enzyme A